MKRPFTIYDLPEVRSRLGSWTIRCRRSASSAAVTLRLILTSSTSATGVALIITLILLAVVTFMALTFLAISRRERGAVTTTHRHRLAQNWPPTTRWPPPRDKSSPTSSPPPIPTTSACSSRPITSIPADFRTGVASLYQRQLLLSEWKSVCCQQRFSPKPGQPVLPPAPAGVHPTNANPNDPLDFRFYLDLNRNGRDDPNGWVPEIGNNGLSIVEWMTRDQLRVPINGRPGMGWRVATSGPAVRAEQSVCGALRLHRRAHRQRAGFECHSQPGSRRTIGDWKGVPVNPSRVMDRAGDAFLRNQGVGSWEINLAAFLADLNTNQWGHVVDSAADQSVIIAITGINIMANLYPSCQSRRCL